MFKLMKKRLFVFAVILAVCISFALSGCKSSDKIKLDPKNPVTVTIWHYYHGSQKTAFDDMVKKFNESLGFEKGIIIDSVGYGGVDELARNVLASARGDKGASAMPDIFNAYNDVVYELLKMDKVAELNKYLTDKELGEYEQAFINEGKMGTDNLYVFPIAKSTESLMLNKTDFDIFLEALKTSEFKNETVGYEDLATWEGIVKIADLYRRFTASVSGGDGKAFISIDSLANYIIVGSKQLGQDLVKVRNGSATFNFDEEIMSKLWYTYYDNMLLGNFIKYGNFGSDDVKTGHSLCYIGSTSSARYFPTEFMISADKSVGIEMAVLPMPVFEGGQKVAISQGAGMAVAKSDEKKEYAAALFLKWFTDAERNVSFSLNSGYLPVKSDALSGNYLDEAFASLESSDTATQNVISVLRLGIEQMKTYEFYASDVFDGGTEFRPMLANSLSENVQQDCSEYKMLVANGENPDKAYNDIKEKNKQAFNDWLLTLKNLK